ncbi:hypothetical protein B0H15DRAFT_413634 [Mycena belliarum]|uniref:UDP-glycosyltransferases domain-containing protein n=1 Tax=Mycena belliarum TaxID=1033014 RepID=A0AAD6UK12_9AGAR|nr:hypothetical protein B0H15DRAFT_413634 [Mycena belliae]
MALSPLTEDFFDFDIVPVARKIHSDEELRRGRSMDEILEQVAMANNGSDCFSGVIVKHPGSPDMYDYETVARGAGPSSTTGFAHQSAAQQAIKIQMLAKAVDGWIVPTSICLEPVGVPYWREYFKKHGQELFTVGPQALGWLDTAPTAPTNPVVHAFLESSLSQFGAKSVLYISFGSIAFPAATPDLVTALVDTLLALEPRFPFIFALGNEIAALSSELTERVHLSGKGLICDFWVEQRAILQHAAVGWFLTHGGYNSLTEGLCQGIPLIMWPVFAEQPLNAALFSSGPNPVAFELMQIRTGTQCAPSLRGGPAITGTVEDALAEFRATFEAARGARGAALQENAEIMARALQEARAGEFQDALTRLARF